MEVLLLALAVAVVVALVACCTLTAVRQRRLRPAAAMPSTASMKPANLVRPSALAQENRQAPQPGKPTEIARVPGLTMREAEDLLDWLEQNGYPEREVVCEADMFTVRFRVDAGHTVERHSARHAARAARDFAASAPGPRRGRCG